MIRAGAAALCFMIAVGARKAIIPVKTVSKTTDLPTKQERELLQLLA